MCEWILKDVCIRTVLMRLLISMPSLLYNILLACVPGIYAINMIDAWYALLIWEHGI